MQLVQINNLFLFIFAITKQLIIIEINCFIIIANFRNPFVKELTKKSSGLNGEPTLLVLFTLDVAT